MFRNFILGAFCLFLGVSGCMKKNRYRLNANSSSVTNGNQTLQPPTCKNTDVRVEPMNLANNTAEVGESVSFKVTYQSSQLGDFPYCFDQLRYLDSVDNQFKPIPVSGVILTKAYTAVAASQTETLQFRFEGGSAFPRESESFNIVQSVSVDLRATHNTVYFERPSGWGTTGGTGDIELRPNKKVKLVAIESSRERYVINTTPSLPHTIETNTTFKLTINTSSIQGTPPTLTLKYKEILASGQEAESVLEQTFDVSHEKCKWTMTDSFWGVPNTTLVYNCQTQRLTRMLPDGESIVGSLPLPAPTPNWKFQILHGRLSADFGPNPHLVVYSRTKGANNSWQGQVSLVRLDRNQNPFVYNPFPMSDLQLCGDWNNPESTLGSEPPPYLLLMSYSQSFPAQLRYSPNPYDSSNLEAELSYRRGGCSLGRVKETITEDFTAGRLETLFAINGGNFSLGGGVLNHSGAAVGVITLREPASRNGTVEVDFDNFSVGSYFGLLARHGGMGDGDNGFLVQMHHHREGEYTIKFYQMGVVEGSLQWRELAQGAGHSPRGTLRFEVHQGNVLKAFVNNELKLSHTASGSVPPKGKFGIRAYGTVEIDNFKVSAELE